MTEDEQILLVGGGGREHAIARAIAQSTHKVDLFACASHRNPGIARVASAYQEIDETNVDRIVEYASTIGATLVVIGPEAPLEAGVADALESIDVYVFGPRQAEARIETDKAFQREFIRENEIPGCPDFAVFEDMDAACDYIDEYPGDLAVKPAGLTGGKGVRVIGDQLTADEAKTYIRNSEYDKIVLEERLIGEEFTLQAFVANGTVRPTPAVQDHKRAFEGDTGPNTGGMGSYSAPNTILPFMTRADYDRAVEIMEAVIEALPAYKGILYGQFMLTADGPAIVEFNARFGDPEAMNTLPILQTDFVDILRAARANEPLPSLEFRSAATVCKYAVPKGYPTNPVGGRKILPINNPQTDNTLVFYASVDEQNEEIYTTTSRAFAVVGIADTITEAEQSASSILTEIDSDDLRIRHDIGTPALIQRRIDHMNELRGPQT